MVNKISQLNSKWNDNFSSISKEYQGVMLSWSGGVDSTVLFHLFYDFFKSKKNFQFSVFHTNFALRGKESDLDERFIKDTASRYGVSCNILQLDDNIDKNRSGQSIQEWARLIRYDELQKFVDKGWLIALAHNQNDVAENTLLRLSRGTSPSSVAGMSEWNPPYWRPLLDIPKDDIIEWAERHKLPHREDSSNAKIDYSRNVIRHEVLPKLEELFPGATERIARVAKQTETIASFATKHYGIKHDKETRWISLKALSQIDKPLRTSAIASLLSNKQTGHKQLSHKQLDHIVYNATYNPKIYWSQQIAGGGLLEIKDDKLIFSHPKQISGKRTQQHLASFYQLDLDLELLKNQMFEFEMKGEKIRTISITNKGDTSKHLKVYNAGSKQTLNFSHSRVKVKDLFKSFETNAPVYVLHSQGKDIAAMKDNIIFEPDIGYNKEKSKLRELYIKIH